MLNVKIAFALLAIATLAAASTKESALPHDEFIDEKAPSSSSPEINAVQMKQKVGWHRHRPHIHHPHRYHVHVPHRHNPHIHHPHRYVPYNAAIDKIKSTGKGLGNSMGGAWKGISNAAVKSAQAFQRTASNVAAWAEEVAKKALPFLSCLAGVDLDCFAKAAAKLASTGVLDIGCPECLSVSKWFNRAAILTENPMTYETGGKYLTAKEELMLLEKHPKAPREDMLQIFEKYEPTEELNVEDDARDMRIFIGEVKKNYIAQGKQDIADSIKWSPDDDDEDELVQIGDDNADALRVGEQPELTVKEQTATTTTLAAPSNILTKWDTRHESVSLIQDAAQGAGFTFKKELMDKKLTLEASATLKGCFFILANFGRREIGFGMKNAGVDLVFKANFKYTKGKSKSKTKYYKLTDGKKACRTPSGTKCRPLKLFKKMVMIGPVPLMVAIFTQLRAALTLEADFQGSVDIGAEYRHELKFDKLTVKYSSGGLNADVKVSSTPSMTQTQTVTGAGSSTGTLKLGPKIFVTVNAVPFSVWPNIKFILKATATITWTNMGLLQAPVQSADKFVPEGKAVQVSWGRRRRFQTARRRRSPARRRRQQKVHTCVEGKISAGGTTSVSVPSAADTADMLCQAAVKYTCDDPKVRAANCVAKGFGKDPCAMAGDMCSGMATAIRGAIPDVRGAEFSVATPEVRAFHSCKTQRI